MKLHPIYTGCTNGITCPTIYKTDDGRFAVQGYKLSEEERRAIAIPQGEDIIVLPRDFFDFDRFVNQEK